MRGMDERAGGTGAEEPMTLRQWRDRRALGTAELAAIAGVSKVTVIAVEHGRVTAIKRRTMRRLAAALEVEPADVAEFRRALSGDAHEDGELNASYPCVARPGHHQAAPRRSGQALKPGGRRSRGLRWASGVARSCPGSATPSAQKAPGAAARGSCGAGVRTPMKRRPRGSRPIRFQSSS